jgi:hypothetical protein
MPINSPQVQLEPRNEIIAKNDAPIELKKSPLSKLKGFFRGILVSVLANIPTLALADEKQKQKENPHQPETSLREISSNSTEIEFQSLQYPVPIPTIETEDENVSLHSKAQPDLSEEIDLRYWKYDTIRTETPQAQEKILNNKLRLYKTDRAAVYANTVGTIIKIADTLNQALDLNIDLAREFSSIAKRRTTLPRDAENQETGILGPNGIRNPLETTEEEFWLSTFGTIGGAMLEILPDKIRTPITLHNSRLESRVQLINLFGNHHQITLEWLDIRDISEIKKAQEQGYGAQYAFNSSNIRAYTGIGTTFKNNYNTSSIKTGLQIILEDITFSSNIERRLDNPYLFTEHAARWNITENISITATLLSRSTARKREIEGILSLEINIGELFFSPEGLKQKTQASSQWGKTLQRKLNPNTVARKISSRSRNVQSTEPNRETVH